MDSGCRIVYSPRVYLIGHDIGTSAVKSVLTTLKGQAVVSAESPLQILRPKPLHAEQRPTAWIDAIAANTRALLASAQIAPQSVAAMSFGAQMQGTVLVDAGGEPLHDAMIWLDMRAEAYSHLAVAGWPKAQGYGLFRLWRWLRLTGGVPGLSGRDPTAKMLWLKHEAPELWAKAHAALDVKDFIIGYCTGRFVTSHDCANTTWLMDSRPGRLAWSQELCDRLGLDQAKLPQIAASTDVAGTLTQRAAERFGLTTATRVFVGSGDLVAMAIGTGATAIGSLCVAIGTSAWVSAHVPSRRCNVNNYTASICSAAAGSHLVVAHQESGGACLTWLRDHLGGGRDLNALLDLGASAPPGSLGLHFLPWMNGEYAPVDDPFVRGGFVNLSFEHSIGNMVRAVLEGVAYNVQWALRGVETLSGACSDELRVGGGAAQSGLWCQTLADVLGRTVFKPKAPGFAVAQGAAFIAAVGLGELAGFDAVPGLVNVAERFTPSKLVRPLHDARYQQLTSFYKTNRKWFRLANQPQLSAL